MAITHSPAVTGRRPAAVLTTVGVLVFLGISAVAGGTALVFNVGAAPPAGWLEAIPLVDSWLVPGLVLGVGFGVGSLIAAYGMLRRPRWPWLAGVERQAGHHWSWLATLLIGAGHVVWIGLELAYLPELSILQLVYGAVGVALVLLPTTAAVREHLRVAVPPGSARRRSA